MQHKKDFPLAAMLGFGRNIAAQTFSLRDAAPQAASTLKSLPAKFAAAGGDLLALMDAAFTPQGGMPALAAAPVRNNVTPLKPRNAFTHGFGSK